MCNKIFREYCDIFLDDEHKCNKLNICLVDVYGEEDMMRRCKKLGLDIEYEEEWKGLMGKYDLQKM